MPASRSASRKLRTVADSYPIVASRFTTVRGYGWDSAGIASGRTANEATFRLCGMLAPLHPHQVHRCFHCGQFAYIRRNQPMLRDEVRRISEVSQLVEVVVRIFSASPYPGGAIFTQDRWTLLQRPGGTPQDPGSGTMVVVQPRASHSPSCGNGAERTRSLALTPSTGARLREAAPNGAASRSHHYRFTSALPPPFLSVGKSPHTARLTPAITPMSLPGYP
jgi:hypothetical protein